MTSDWIGTLKGPNVCAQRFSRVSPLHQSLLLVLVRERENTLGTRREVVKQFTKELVGVTATHIDSEGRWY